MCKQSSKFAAKLFPLHLVDTWISRRIRPTGLSVPPRAPEGARLEQMAALATPLPSHNGWLCCSHGSLYNPGKQQCPDSGTSLRPHILAPEIPRTTFAGKPSSRFERISSGGSPIYPEGSVMSEKAAKHYKTSHLASASLYALLSPLYCLQSLHDNQAFGVSAAQKTRCEQ
ncbi:hypothetical protein SRHO_G00235140 [Serrasalmus rhombeus]